MSNDDLVLVKFKGPNSPYVSGEQAGFKRTLAAKLVNAGKAVYVNAEDAPVSKPADEPAKETGLLDDEGKDEGTGESAGDEEPTPKASKKKKTKKRGGLFGGS